MVNSECIQGSCELPEIGISHRPRSPELVTPPAGRILPGCVLRIYTKSNLPRIEYCRGLIYWYWIAFSRWRLKVHIYCYIKGVRFWFRTNAVWVYSWQLINVQTIGKVGFRNATTPLWSYSKVPTLDLFEFPNLNISRSLPPAEQ